MIGNRRQPQTICPARFLQNFSPSPYLQRLGSPERKHLSLNRKPTMKTFLLMTLNTSLLAFPLVLLFYEQQNLVLPNGNSFKCVCCYITFGAKYYIIQLFQIFKLMKPSNVQLSHFMWILMIVKNLRCNKINPEVFCFQLMRIFVCIYYTREANFTRTIFTTVRWN